MSSVNLVLVFAVLSCVWVFALAKGFSGKSSRKNLASLAAAVIISLLLAAANLGTEWIIRRVAGDQFTEPQQALQAARATNGEAGALSAYMAGTLATSFNHGRERATSLGLATVLCLVSGLWFGRRHMRPPAPSGSTPFTADAA